MNKIQIEDNFFLYQFPEFPKMHFGVNLYVLIHQNEALLIDTAFETETKTVIKDLEKNNIKVKKVILSHFHGDHITGLRELSDVEVYGSKNGQKTLDKYTPRDEHHLYLPHFYTEDFSVIHFGEFELQFIAAPGHSDCSINIIINRQYLLVGDNIMTSNDGTPLLPSVLYSNVKNHILALEKLKKYKNYKILPAHGIILRDADIILTSIKNRITYLNNIIVNREYITVDEALKNCQCNFLHQQWHEDVYKE
ncbi:MAG: MBL fold metallo-hydrolase [Spirochaetes bacterium]|nr:MBL fold metallo-hydrolase [Spirochaetota bacterium]